MLLSRHYYKLSKKGRRFEKQMSNTQIERKICTLKVQLFSIKFWRREVLRARSIFGKSRNIFKGQFFVFQNFYRSNCSILLYTSPQNSCLATQSLPIFIFIFENLLQICLLFRYKKWFIVNFELQLWGSCRNLV